MTNNLKSTRDFATDTSATPTPAPTKNSIATVVGEGKP